MANKDKITVDFMISIFMVLISKTTQTEKVIKMNIYVSERNVYGRATIYPQCDKAKAFAKIGRASCRERV